MCRNGRLRMPLFPVLSRTTLTLLALFVISPGTAHGSGKAKQKKKGAAKPGVARNIPPPPAPAPRPPDAPTSKPPAKGLSPEDARRLKMLLAQREAQRKKDLEMAMGLGSQRSRAAAHSGRAEAKVVLEPGYLPRGVHPFFDLSVSTPVGRIKIFNNVEGKRAAAIRDLVTSAEGFLLWLDAESGNIQAMSPNGLQFEFSVGGNSVIRHLLRDSMGSIWFFGDASYGRVAMEPSASGGDPRSLGIHSRTSHNRECMAPGVGPGCVALGTAGEVGGFTEAHRFSLKDGEQTRFTEIEAGELPSAAIWDERMRSFVAIRPDKDEYVLFGQREVMDGGLPAGSRPQGLALDPAGHVWITLANRNQVAVLDAMTQTIRYLPPVPGAGGFLAPHGIALGPDGNMWATTASGIVRIKPNGEMTPPYRLPRDMTAVDIWPSKDGRMFFSLANQAGIGAITAVPQSRVPAPGSSAPRTGEESKAPMTSVPAPRKALPKLSRADRYKRQDEWNRKADEIYEARIAQERLDGLTGQNLLGEHLQGEGTAPAEDKDDSVSGPSNPRGEMKAPLAPTTPEAEAGPTPADRLNDLRVFLRPRALEHIYAAHGPWKNMAKSQFAECHDSPEAIERLIATGMENAGVIGSVIDAYGRQYTLCRSEETLWYHERGFSRGGRSFPDRFHPTHLFVVVTMEYGNGVEDEPDHVVLTAYPVSRNW